MVQLLEIKSYATYLSKKDAIFAFRLQSEALAIYLPSLA